MAIEGTFNGNADSRRRELARIHCLARDLGLDRDAYHDVVRAVTGCASASELSAAQRTQLMRHLRAKLGTRDNRAAPGAPHTLANKAMLRKIGALLAQDNKPWAYADALAKRIAKRERLAFCSDAELRKIIAALTYDNGRRRRRADHHA